MDFAAQPQTQPVRLKRALIVDADAEVSRSLSRVLNPEEWSIVRAPDNRSVLKLVEAKPFDLIITGQNLAAKKIPIF